MSSISASRGHHSRGLILCLAMGALALLAVLGRPIWLHRVPVFWDLGCFHLPLRYFYARCLHAGWPFDWLPDMYNGTFITGEGEHGPYHPLHLLLYRCLPLDRAFAIEVFLHFPLMLLGTFVFLRRHAGTAGALLAGLVHAFSANNLYHGNHINFVAVLAHLPWLLWLLERLALNTGASRLLAACGVAVLTGSQLLLGHPQALSYSLLAEVLWALFLARVAVGRWQAALTWTAAKALGLAIGGVQLLSTLAFLRNSNRDTFDPLFGAFEPRRFVQIIAPNLMIRHVPEWWDEPMYFGAVALVLLLWWLTARRAIEADERAGEAVDLRGRLTWFAIVLGGLSLWLATGAYGGLYLVQTHLPILGQLRAPSRYVNLADFAAAVLAGLALGRLSEWVSSGRKIAWRHLVLPWLVAGGAVAAAIAFQVAFPRAEPHGLDRRFLTGTLAAVGAASCLTLACRGRVIGLYGLALLAAADLGQHSLRNRMWGAPLWRGTPTLAEWNASMDLPPVLNQGRVISICSYPARLLHHGQRLVNGYQGGIEPAKWLIYTERKALRVASTAWLRDWDPPLMGPIEGLQKCGAWYRIPDPLPRARLVCQAVPSTDPAADLPSIDVESAALVAQPLALDGPPGTAELIEERPGWLVVHTRAAGRQLLVLSESYDPGWRLSVDGVAGKVERVNGDFLGCVVGPGEHRVELVFRPVSLLCGRLLSLGGVAATLLLAGLAGACLLGRSRTSLQGASASSIQPPPSTRGPS
jgi:hypothetical protein